MAKLKKAKNNSTSQLKAAEASKLDTAGRFHNQFFQIISIGVFCFLLYANTLGHGYTQDDAIVLYDNIYTQQGLKGISGILTNDTFHGFFKDETKAYLVTGGRYRPMTLLMFAMEVELFGMQPFWGHLFNVLWYAATCIALYFLLVALLRERLVGKWGVLIAFTSAMLFAAHPVHTEAVANIKGRDEIIALLGSILAFYWLWKAYRQKNMLWSVLAGVVFFAGLLAKENAITFLAVVPLGFYIFTKANISTIGKYTVPLVLAAVAFILCRSAVIPFNFGTPSMELMNNPYLKLEGNRYVPFTEGERLATIFCTLGKYLLLLVFPHPLTHDYYPRHIGIMQWSNGQSLISLLAYLALAAYAIWGFFRKSVFSFCILFFLATLSIVSNLFFAVGTNMSERFLFMPSVGFVAALSLAGFYGFKEKKVLSRSSLQRWIIVFGVILLAYSIKTFTRNTAWKDNFTLFTTDIKTSANSAKLRNAVGGELVARATSIAEEPKRLSMLKEAVEHLQKAISIHPAYKDAYLILGNAYFHQKAFEQAVQAYEQALKLDPAYAAALQNLQLAYREGGKYFGETKGNLTKAFEFLEKARQLNPNDYDTLRLLGVANGVSGNHSQAIEYFTQAAGVNPDNARAWYELGMAWYNTGEANRANEYVTKAKQLDPKIEETYKQGN